MKTVAIIQARMGASRFPGKMLKELQGKPLIDHVILRLSKILNVETGLNAIVLATSNEQKDDVLAEYIEKAWPEIGLFRGDEKNVLSRFIHVIDQHKPDYVVRITGDCPLVNFRAIEGMLAEIKEADADVVNYVPGYEYVDKGVEVVKASALKSAYNAADLSEPDREHVTAYLYANPNEYNIRYVKNIPELIRADFRITVDTPADLRFLNALCQSIGKTPDNIDLVEVVNHLDNHQDLLDINRLASKKSTLFEKGQVAFRCDGNRHLGLGHVVGCLRMARLLAEEGYGIEFVVKDDTSTVSKIRKAGFSVDIIPENQSPAEDIKHLNKRTTDSKWEALIVNFCKDDLLAYNHLWPEFDKTICSLVFMDNPIPPSCFLADLTINALPHPDYEGYDAALADNVLDGLEYFLLSDDFIRAKSRVKPFSENINRIFIAMGGGDANNITSFVLKVLGITGYQGYVDVVLGSANTFEKEVNEVFQQYQLHGEINKSVKNMSERMEKADLGFSALGLTTYEMASLGLPCIIISGNNLNSVVAEIYSRQSGCAFHLGRYDEVLESEALAFLKELEKKPEIRKDMGAKGRTHIASKTDVLTDSIIRLLAK